MTFEFELPKLPANKTTFCRPGQFASFDFDDITPGQVLNRTWTISSPGDQIQRRRAFTISVKKVMLLAFLLRRQHDRAAAVESMLGQSASFASIIAMICSCSTS